MRRSTTRLLLLCSPSVTLLFIFLHISSSHLGPDRFFTRKPVFSRENRPPEGPKTRFFQKNPENGQIGGGTPKRAKNPLFRGGSRPLQKGGKVGFPPVSYWVSGGVASFLTPPSAHFVVFFSPEERVNQPIIRRGGSPHMANLAIFPVFRGPGRFFGFSASFHGFSAGFSGFGPVFSRGDPYFSIRTTFSRCRGKI